jgi:hypothetical protein
MAGYTADYRSAFDLAQGLAEAEATGTRPELIKNLTRIDFSRRDLGLRRLPPSAAEDPLESSPAGTRPEPFWFLRTVPSRAGSSALRHRRGWRLLDRFLDHADLRARRSGRADMWRGGPVPGAQIACVRTHPLHWPTVRRA